MSEFTYTGQSSGQRFFILVKVGQRSIVGMEIHINTCDEKKNVLSVADCYCYRTGLPHHAGSGSRVRTIIVIESTSDRSSDHYFSSRVFVLE